MLSTPWSRPCLPASRTAPFASPSPRASPSADACTTKSFANRPERPPPFPPPAGPSRTRSHERFLPLLLTRPRSSRRRYVADEVGATLRFFPPLGFAAGAPASALPELVHSDWNLLAEPIAPEWEETPDGPCAVWRNVTGPVFIAW